VTRPHGEHDWLSAEYVREWIEADTTRDAERRPKLRRAAGLLPFDRDEPIRVLDVGGGYGEFSRQVLEAFPASTVVLQDYSGPMLEAARGRLASFGPRVAFRRSDLMVPGWTSELGGPFDAAVSSIAIHNLRKGSAIRAVYCEVARVIRPGGAFFNLDYIFPRSPGLADLYARSGGRAGARRGGERPAGDEPTLEHQLRWLAEGFSEADCLWKDLREALLCGLHERA
jgi:tRNA (cmo5U34)-methyltransferase